jgi:hypothetical protein
MIVSQGGTQRGRPGGKVPGEGRRARFTGLSGVGAQPPNSPKECWDYFLSESIDILASSGMQGTASFDFQQKEQ